MFASSSPFEAGALPSRAAVPAHLRSKSEIRARFRRVRGFTRIDDLYEAGCSRLKFPRSGKDCQGVLVNTAGGMTGGDAASWAFRLDDGARASLATQSAEKIYRSDGEPVRISISIALGKRATLAWVPQEVILFDGARFSRTLDIDMDAAAKLMLLEVSVFGRREKGERITSGAFHDRWIVRRQGEIAFAENVKLAGDIAAELDRPAVGGGAAAIATLLYVAPDAEKRLARARRALSPATSECGASAWDGILVARFLSYDALAVRRDAAHLAARLVPDSLPRIWSF